MIHFSKLKLYGFKSFVDKTELEIGPGLNGIVGPNGCGKSNLVEALRWVMGEKSAKNMRGGGMEDVIFAGTSKRPARNLAEVTVVINNEDGTAPAPFNAATEIEINRKIERDKGSQYRVNGKAVRARDVNLLFADTMTGANSPALVSQGRITEIITAKPADRRKILEESAGITGLHSRRHEAELRLKAAETNLTRLNDSLGDMRTRLSSLKRQARQAERYKEINDKIRRLDMALAWSEWRDSHAKIKDDRAAFAAYNTQVQDSLIVTKSLTDQIEALENTLPDTRKNHMEAQAVLQNFRVSLERLEQDILSKTKGLQDAQDAKSQLEKDQDFTQGQYDHILNDLQNAENDLTTRQDEGTDLPDHITAQTAEIERIETEHQTLINDKQQHETTLAVAAQKKEDVQSQVTDAKNSIDKISNNINILSIDIDNLKEQKTALQDNAILTYNAETAAQALDDLQNTITETESRLSKTRQQITDKTTARDEVRTQLQAIEGELQGLNALLSAQQQDETEAEGEDAEEKSSNLLASLSVKEGYETALAMALGQWATLAGTDAQADAYWAAGGLAADVPDGTQPLSDLVTAAPDALTPLLRSVGVTDTLDKDLAVGQMIVTRDGALKRWDGLTATAAAVDKAQGQAGLILHYRNRVNALQAERDSMTAALTTAEDNVTYVQNDHDAQNDALIALKDEYRTTENTHRNTMLAQEKLRGELDLINDRLQEKTSRLDQNQGEAAEIQSRLDILQKTMATLSDDSGAALTEKIAALKIQIEDKAQQLNTARHNLGELKQTLNTRDHHITTLRGQIEKYRADADRLSARLDEFTARADAIDAKILTLKAASSDDDTDALRESLLNKIADQESALKDVAITLDNQDNAYKRLQAELREAEGEAATARERRAAAQANVANAEEELKRIETVIDEKFSLSPQRLEEQTYSLFDQDIPDMATLHHDRDILIRQRDGIGPVNLRAAIESQETETQLAEMEGEYNDLIAAIEQLRGGIAKLNKEAKERLAIAFTRVDQHFQKLFAQLFEGGKAYLEMIQSDDPMDSGLEIYAQPPGKSLQKLSLLSGGEQTLTATALIFGMFLTNPSPICVLDEIDAPLDDANVDRVCGLMEHIARDTNTRFIVITHHRMTMARMDRLYGVTMGERGVSQLVSVDMALQGEMDLAETG